MFYAGIARGLYKAEGLEVTIDTGSSSVEGINRVASGAYDVGFADINSLIKFRDEPRAKTLIFSDQLTIPIAVDIARRFQGRALTSFGIGTNLTNDLGYEPINIVIKMTECNGQPVAKVSDAPGKTISKDPGYLAYLRQVFGIAQPVEHLRQRHLGLHRHRPHRRPSWRWCRWGCSPRAWFCRCDLPRSGRRWFPHSASPTSKQVLNNTLATLTISQRAGSAGSFFFAPNPTFPPDVPQP